MHHSSQAFYTRTELLLKNKDPRSKARQRHTLSLSESVS